MDVVVVGSCNMDLISYTPRLPKPGETLHGHRFSLGFGGKGANQCVAAARLGASAAMVAKVGEDTFGKDYIQNLKDNSINVDYVSTTGTASTGVAPISVDDNGQNSIIIVSGANMQLSEGDIDSSESLIASAKVVMCQLEIDPRTTLHALRVARKHGVKTVLNPAPAQAQLDPEMYTNCDFFCPNETEAEILTGLPVKSVDDAKQAAPRLLEKGCGAVVITLGAEGAVYATRDCNTPVHIPAESVTPLDTTGAGDSFIGALGYYLSRTATLTLDEAIRRACVIATRSVQVAGTQTSYPLQKDLPESLFS